MLKLLILVTLMVTFTSHTALAQLNDKQQQLLNRVENYQYQDSQLNKAREQRFSANLAKQQRLLKQSDARLAAAKKQQEILKNLFNNNDEQLVERQAELDRVSGKLGEVFGIVKQTATQLRPLLADSIISSQHSDRDVSLQFAEAKRIPNVEDFQALWYQLQLEMMASGEIIQFKANIIDNHGDQAQTLVTRFGSFSAITAQGDYLRWGDLHDQLTVLPVQPLTNGAQMLSRYIDGSEDEILVDPSRGELLTMLERMPTLADRLKQAGEIGYLIVALGVLGIIVLLFQLSRSVHVEYKVQQQLKQPTRLNDNNPLGRILMAVDPQAQSLESLELKIDECTVKEVPRLEQGQNFIKLLATVAPLLGLLGTVTGMIGTFQSITLYGTSDPKLMANGISQALMTTALGLLVAIPLMFGHSYLSSRSRRLGQILQEKTLAALYKAMQKNKAVNTAAVFKDGA